MALLEVRNLTKIYKSDEGVETSALQGVSFEIEKGEFVAIMGASGSGKSTLLHILGFLDHQTNGEYRFDQRTIDDYSEVELAHMRNEKLGFVFQAFNLLPRTSVVGNVQLPLLYSDIPESEWSDRVTKAIEEVDLSHRMDHAPSQLSGGEKQRVAIARALVNNPQIIFADEPTGNLDSKSGKMIIEILQKLNRQGHTVVLITHEAFIGEYTKRIIRLHDGKIIKS